MYNAYLSDLDGRIYLSDTLLSGAAETVAVLRAAYDLPVEHPDPYTAAIRDEAHVSRHSYVRRAYYELLICAGAVLRLIYRLIAA